ncbi:MAG: TonB-dependent receptor domain-containing protein, partial [Bacteroidota bacterium]
TTGGLEAQYGDVTGGVIAITTRGASPFYSGGVEFQTSEFLDAYGYRLATGSVSGPIYTRRDSAGKKVGQPLAGFFLAAEYQYDKDPSPSAIPIYKVKDDILESAISSPLVRDPSGFTYIHRSHYWTYDSLDKVKARPNVAADAYRFNGRLDLQPVKNVTVAFGGSLERSKSRDFIDIYSLMDYDNNPQTINTNWRAWGRITQRFVSEGKEGASSALKSAYYSIQADYSRNTQTSQDFRLKDDLFRYGHVGKFTTYSVPFYQGEAITRPGLSDSLVFTQIANFDTLYDFVPGDANPEISAYTSQYYDITDPLGTSGYQDSYGTLLLRGALVNGDNRNPLTVYGLWGTTGRLRNFYGETDNSQFRLTARGSVDINNHNIILGMEYEQRTDRGWSVNPSNLWSLMRQLSNSRLTGFDTTTAVITSTTSGGTPITFITYPNANYSPTTNLDGQVAPGFFEKVRDHLGIAYTDTIQIDALDPSQLSLDLFSPDELLDFGFVNYYGYTYTGEKLTGQPAYEDYFIKKDSKNNYLREVDAFRPNYVAGYIQDRFTFKDITFNVGLRVDRFDANQKVLRDKYLLYPTYTAGDPAVLDKIPNAVIPSNIGSDFAVYVNNVQNPTAIVGFRDGDQWYNAEGTPITDLSPLLDNGTGGSGIQPFVKNYSDVQQSIFRPEVFTDYSPQINLMPRIAFSFPISDEAILRAHYDVLTQRPQNSALLRLNPGSYGSLARGISGTISNPDLKPERTVEYEVTFEQRLSRSSALSIAAFYRELRDQIQIINVQYAYPITYSTYGNIDFGTVKGLSFAYDLRRTNNVRMNFSYTLQFADGTGSSPFTSAGVLAQQGQTNLRQPQPLSFDQRHTFVATFDYHYGRGKDYNGPVMWGRQVLAEAGLNLILRAGSGTPYSRQSNITPTADFTSTANSRSVLTGSINGSRLPWQFRIDARVDKNFEIKMGKKQDGEARNPVAANIYLLVQNVLDAQNILGVYAATGDPADDGYLSSPGAQAFIDAKVNPQSYIDMYEIAQNNPGNYQLPRRIRLGLQLNF